MAASTPATLARRLARRLPGRRRLRRRVRRDGWLLRRIVPDDALRLPRPPVNRY